MKRLLLVGSMLAACASPALANFIVGDVADTKIFFNSGKAVITFTGNVDTNNTGPLVNFTADQPVDVSNGFATIKPDDITGTFSQLNIIPTEDDWSAFTFRGQINPVGFLGTVKLTVDDQFANTPSQTFTYVITKPDQDFGDLGIVSTDNERITSITLATQGNETFKELKQFEVQRKTADNCTDPNGCVINPVITDTPEPWSIALLGTGLLGLGTIREWNKRRSNV